MQDFEGQEAWVGVAQRMHERGLALHQASLKFLKKSEENHLNAAIALRCSEEARKLDLSLMKIIYPYGHSPEARRSKSPKPPKPLNPILSDALLDALFEPEENEYAQMDTRSTTKTVTEDPAVETLETQHGGKESPRQE